MKLRPYQHEAVASTLEQLRQHRSTLGVLPTGTGKTVVFSHVIDQFPGRALVLAHTTELIAQAADKIKRVTGHHAEIEMADSRANHDGFLRSRVVVASKDSLHPGRLKRFKRNEFSLIVVDEAHRSVAKSYTHIIQHFESAKVFGVTATPDRRDEVGLKAVFESVAFNHTLRDMVRDGWLVPLVQRQVTVTGLDYSKAKITAGDLNQGDIASAVAPVAILHQIVSATVREAGNRRTLVFAPPGYAKDAEYHVATRLCELFNDYRPNSARRVSQDTPKDERAQIVKDFADGAFQYLVNVGVFTEGFDDPGVECVAVARATTSRALYAQMVGRGTRPLPGVVDGHDDAGSRLAAIGASAKPTLLVLDFNGNAGKHSLVGLPDILAGRDPALAQKVRKRLELAGGGDPLQAEEEEEELELRRVEVERDRRAKIVAEATYTYRDVSPWEVAGVAPPKLDLQTAARPPSEAQVNLLNKLKCPIPSSMTEASALIKALLDRRQRGLCGYALAKALKAKGLNPDVTNEEARQWLSEIESFKLGKQAKRSAVFRFPSRSEAVEQPTTSSRR